MYLDKNETFLDQNDHFCIAAVVEQNPFLVISPKVFYEQDDIPLCLNIPFDKGVGPILLQFLSLPNQQHDLQIKVSVSPLLLPLIQHHKQIPNVIIDSKSHTISCLVSSDNILSTMEEFAAIIMTLGLASDCNFSFM